jgi:FMN phosphatase YigB (HAD superfamily)
MHYDLIVFDFDGVLCRDRFYARTLLPEHTHVFDWIECNIFGNKILLEQWMKGKMTSEEVNRIIAKACSIEFDFLYQQFLESVRLMRLDEQVKSFCVKLRSSGVKIGLVTNNMDVFSRITIKNHQLDELFHTIANSSDYGMLKKDADGELYDIALKKIGVDIRNSIVVDDSPGVIELYKQKGGEGFLYRDYQELLNFLSMRGVYVE